MLSISFKDFVAIQNDIYMLTLDDYAPHGVLGGQSRDENPIHWQYTVDIIYRCLAAGFWRIWNSPLLTQNSIVDHEGFCKKLSELSPFELSEEGEDYWLGTMLCCTELSLSLVKRFGVNGMVSDGFCEPFVIEVEQEFLKHDVSWSRGSFFTVKAHREIKGWQADSQ